MRLLAPTLALFICAMSAAAATEIIAHRGASKDAPENTLAAFRLGYEQKADACELDIYLTKDGQIAVIHDKTTKRTAGKDALVVEQTMAELRELDAGLWKGEMWKGEKIPTITEALAIIPEGRQLFIEIKCGPEIVVPLQKVIAASVRKAKELVIISFNYEAIKQARALMPEIDAYFLASYREKKDQPPASLPEFIAKAVAAKLTGLDLDYRFPIDKAFVQQIKDAGLKLQVWTVDDPAVARKLADAGVQGITTNRPAFLREALE